MQSSTNVQFQLSYVMDFIKRKIVTNTFCSRWFPLSFSFTLTNRKAIWYISRITADDNQSTFKKCPIVMVWYDDWQCPMSWCGIWTGYFKEIHSVINNKLRCSIPPHCLPEHFKRCSKMMKYCFI